MFIGFSLTKDATVRNGSHFVDWFYSVVGGYLFEGFADAFLCAGNFLDGVASAAMPASPAFFGRGEFSFPRLQSLEAFLLFGLLFLEILGGQRDVELAVERHV